MKAYELNKLLQSLHPLPDDEEWKVPEADGVAQVVAALGLTERWEDFMRCPLWSAQDRGPVTFGLAAEKSRIGSQIRLLQLLHRRGMLKLPEEVMREEQAPGGEGAP